MTCPPLRGPARALMTLVMATSFAGAARPAVADPVLLGSMPADGSTVTALPERVLLQFSEPSHLATLAVRDGDTLVERMRPQEIAPQRNHRLPMPSLEPGAYVLDWRVIARDGQMAQGTIRFTLEEPTTQP